MEIILISTHTYIESKCDKKKRMNERKKDENKYGGLINVRTFSHTL